MKSAEAVPTALFDLGHTAAAELLAGCRYPWEVLPLIKGFILEYIRRLDEECPDEYIRRAGDIRVHRSARVFESAYIAGPCVIGPGSEVRHCAFIRGSALIGAGCTVGNSTELKNVILFDDVEVPHYNYVGDSVLGWHAHMGAGSITSNVKSDRKNIRVHLADGDIETGLRKIGAMLGDYAEIGCGSVLNPGSIVGRNAIVYPLSSVRGAVDADTIYKKQGETVARMNN